MGVTSDAPSINLNFIEILSSRKGIWKIKMKLHVKHETTYQNIKAFYPKNFQEPFFYLLKPKLPSIKTKVIVLANNHSNKTLKLATS